MLIKTLFKQKSPLFIPFMMGGFPDYDLSVDALMTLSESGADIIEIGVPFSEPVADGPINQHAAHVALENNINLDSLFNMVSAIRDKKITTPIILFSYYNPILAYGLERFIEKSKQIGINGLLIVDLPPEEGEDIYAKIKDAGLEIVLLVSPTTMPERHELYQKLDPSFIYYISRLAVTGTQNVLPPELKSEVLKLKKIFTNTPIAVGFGISTGSQASEVASYADGVIIGSKLVQLLKETNVSTFKQASLDFSEAIRLTRV